MRSVLLTATIVFTGFASPVGGGGDMDAVRKAVLEPQAAGWERHDFKAYMAQWADDAKLVIARQEKPDKYDTVFNRKQIEATRRLLMRDKPAQGQKITFENVKVSVTGDEAELRLRSKLFVGDDYQIADEVFRLRMTRAGWKVTLNRGWLIKAKFGNEVISYDAEKWKKLDQDADELLRSDKRGDRAAQALLFALRPAEAHTLLKKVTERKDAAASDWVERGHAAMSAGDAGDAMESFQRALKLDENAPVPGFARKAEGK